MWSCIVRALFVEFDCVARGLWLQGVACAAGERAAPRRVRESVLFRRVCLQL